MIRISQYKCKITDQNPEKRICEMLKIDSGMLISYEIKKRSIDARKKPDLYWVYTIDCKVNCSEDKLVKKLHNANISIIKEIRYEFPYHAERVKERPVIIGTGPAGLFCGYMLAMNGFNPILLERGGKAEERLQAVNHFWEKGTLDTESNVQFGEGGAGTFSDGKLNTLVKDKDGRNRKVLEIFHENGAEEEILYDYKAHIGTDRLVTVITNIRKEMEAHGAEFHFHSKVVEILTRDNHAIGVRTEDGTEYFSNQIVAAIGHSARDTYPFLLKAGCAMESKDFAVGFRVIHPQRMINHSQYGIDECETLGAATYKVAGNEENGKNAYSFCMCPGGYVVNASSENERLAINGMSYSGRDSKCANSAIICTISKKRFESQDPLSGIQYQRKLEEKAYQLGQGSIPVEELGEFRENENVQSPYRNACDEYFTDFEPCIKGKYRKADVHKILDDDLNQLFLKNMDVFAQKIKGFANDHVIVAGIESRTTSPVRITRDENLSSNLKGIFPCGEGAGYAGGITSAAMDGIRVAEEIAKLLLVDN